jgi:hypothetical protein
VTTRTAATFAAVAVALVVLAVAWVGRVSEGRRALAESSAALARGDTFEAIVAARAAAEARCPGCTAPAAAFDRLASIAKQAEDKGDVASAFAAWRAARAAALATGAPKVRADQEIARLGQKLDAAQVAAGAPATEAASEERLRAALATSSVPGVPTLAILAAGGALFLAAAFRFARGGRRLPDLALAVVGAGVAAVALAFF